MGSNPGPAPTAEPEIFRLKGFRTWLSLGWTSASLHDRRDFGHFRRIEISILLPSKNFIFHRFISGPLVLVRPRLCRLKRRFFDSQGKSLQRQQCHTARFLVTRGLRWNCSRKRRRLKRTLLNFSSLFRLEQH